MRNPFRNERTKAAVIIIIGLLTGLLISFLLYRIKPHYLKSSAKISQRIISLAPNVTEIIFALGKGGGVAGRSDFCLFPLEALSIPSVGNNFTVGFERILKMQPGLLLNQGENPRLKQFCSTHGIRYLGVNMDSISSILKGIETIGKALQAEEKAKNLISYIKSELKMTQTLTVNRIKKSVLVIINRRAESLSGIFTIGKRSFLSELIYISGGSNVFQDISLNYSEVSIENVIRRNPDIIIEISVNEKFTPEKEQIRLKQWSAHPSINAVRNKRIYFISDDYVLVPGPRIDKIAKLFSHLIHGQER